MTHDEQELLRRAGELLYGPAWQSELARTLSVAVRTVQRWLAGDRSPDAKIWSELAALAREQREDLTELIEALADRAEEGR